MFISKIYNNTNLQIPCLYVGCTPIYLNFKYYEEVEVFSRQTSSEKGQIEIYSYVDRLLCILPLFDEFNIHFHIFIIYFIYFPPPNG